MKAKKATIWISCIFLFFLFSGLLLHALLPDEDVSFSERRTLRQFPAVTWRAVREGAWMDAFESYLLDQFPARDTLRGIKAALQFSVFRQSDNNGIYLQDGHVFKMYYDLNEASVIQFSEKLNDLYRTQLREANVYFAVIPDKSQYLIPQTHLRLPYDSMVALTRQHLDLGIQEIPLKDTLALTSFYRTDLHWRQEMLWPVVEQLGAYMGFETCVPEQEVTAQEYSPFYGSYYGQAALFGLAPDTLVYLQNSFTDAAVVEDMQHPTLRGVYNIKGLYNIDSYDVFLNGATPLITIHNESVQSGRRLLLFRDSYSSSIAPLLLFAYEEITLIDLRYISSSLLTDYVDFTAQDVLFLYGEQILNNSALLK